MWIVMKETYAGGIGCFLKGHKYDLAPGTVKLIPTDCYEGCCAPWEEKKDAKAIRLIQLEAEAKETRQRAEQLQSEADQYDERVEQFAAQATEKQDRLSEANQAANTAIAESKKLSDKKQLGENEKKTLKKLKAEAFRLAAMANKKGLEQQRAHGELLVAIADHGLKQLEANDAKKAAEKAARTIDEVKQAEAAAKVKAEAKAKAEAEAKAKAEAEAEAKAKEEATAKAAAKAERVARIEAERNAQINANLRGLTGGSPEKPKSKPRPKPKAKPKAKPKPRPKAKE